MNVSWNTEAAFALIGLACAAFAFILVMQRKPPDLGYFGTSS